MTSQTLSSTWLSNLQSQTQFVISPNHPRLAYRSRQWHEKQHITGWGQRKLFFSELQFMNKYSHLSSNVVYAGAAPGTHIPYLSCLFPTHTFYLIDPNPFAIQETEHIKINNNYFTDEIAQTFAGQRVLFISDIRTADYRQMTELENEHFIIKDNHAQIQWVTIMKPIRSSLKFRCPYANLIQEPTQMLKGDIYLQIWMPPSSTETRLVVDDSLEMTEYDNLVYEEQLFYHNVVTRNQTFIQPVKGEGLKARYDDLVEVMILGDYLQQHHAYVTPKMVAKFSQLVSKNISRFGRTLKIKNKDPSMRRQFPQVNHKSFHKI